MITRTRMFHATGSFGKSRFETVRGAGSLAILSGAARFTQQKRRLAGTARIHVRCLCVSITWTKGLILLICVLLGCQRTTKGWPCRSRTGRIFPWRRSRVLYGCQTDESSARCVPLPATSGTAYRLTTVEAGRSHRSCATVMAASRSSSPLLPARYISWQMVMCFLCFTTTTATSANTSRSMRCITVVQRLSL
ncbi:hypothetical protein D3C85_1312570 [compost metagenome]